MYPWRDEVETALNTSYSRPSWCTAVPSVPTTAPCARVWITRDENLSRGIYHLRGDAFRLTECVSPPLLLALSFTRLLLARTQFKFEAVNGLRRKELGSTESFDDQGTSRSRLRSRLMQHRWRKRFGEPEMKLLRRFENAILESPFFFFLSHHSGVIWFGCKEIEWRFLR